MEEHHYKIIDAEEFPTRELFIEVAKNYGKCQLDETGGIAFLVTPTSAPPSVNNPKKSQGFGTNVPKVSPSPLV